MEVAKWNQFVKSKVQDALDSGSALALASAAFLAVYREGFETVLFYKALFVAGGDGTMPVVAGIAVAARWSSSAVYVAINRFGVRLPLKPFFARHQRVPVLHGVRVRGEGHRRAAGGRPDRHHDRLVGAAHSRARHLSRPSSRSARRRYWSCSRSSR